MNFEHGDEVALRSVNDGHLCTVHAPRWWMVLAHVQWVVLLLLGRTATVTFSDGVKLRLVR